MRTTVLARKAACSIRQVRKRKAVSAIFFLFSRADFRTGGGVGEPRERESAEGVLTSLCPSESACTFDSDRSAAEIAVKGTMAYFRHESKKSAAK